MASEFTTTSNQAFKVKPLIIMVLLISSCAIIYELIISSISAYLLGNSVKQYSLTIGLFMSAMGVGSYLTKYLRQKLFESLVLVELLIGVVGGISATLLYAVYGMKSFYQLLMYVMTILIGVLVGLEIPLITRILEAREQNLRLTMANVLSMDYLGALLGSVAFPILLLPYLGEIQTSFLVGLINVILATFLIYTYQEQFEERKRFKQIAWCLMLLLFLGLLFGNFLGNQIENNLYRDQIIYRQQTPYQKIILTRHRDDLRLFLDGNVQFSSLDEYRYHEALVHPAMSLLKRKAEILILGGGDGLALREILKYSRVKQVTLVDLDAEVVKLCQENPLIKTLNQNSLHNSKVKLIYQDAYQYLERTTQSFDLIVVDLPDPNNEALNKLYTNVFYRLLKRRLALGGMIVVQSTSPYFARQAYWCIRATVASEKLFTTGYHLYVPAFGDWGFTLASNEPFDVTNLRLNVPTRYLNQQIISAMFVFAEDEKLALNKVEINRLTKPILLKYYQQAADSW